MTNLEKWFCEPCPTPSHEWLERAEQHQSMLTKPQGSLGFLEDIAGQFCAWQHTIAPKCSDIVVRVFAADHGICDQGVSAFPQAVTAQMLSNFGRGGAAISVLSRRLGADFKAVSLGTLKAVEPSTTVEVHSIASCTKDFSTQPAMSSEQLAASLTVGRNEVNTSTSDLFIAGDMGIGNTTAAAAIYAAILGLAGAEVVGPGTGVSTEVVQHKADLVDAALSLHQSHLSDPIDLLRCIGGFEIAAIVGAYIKAAQEGIPSLVDGFISTAAALLAVEINPSVNAWLMYSHQSAEPGHIKALAKLQARPVLKLGMRLGEGSGAAVAVPLIQSALALHNEMASFADAGVSNRDD